MDNRIVEMVRTAMVPYRLNLKPGDDLVIVSDTGTDPLVTTAFLTAAKALDIEATHVLTKPVQFHHDELPARVYKAMEGADLVHLVTSKASFHSEACRRLQIEGQRFLASEEITADMLREGGATADYETMNRVGERIYDIWANGKEFHLTSPQGTDLVGDIADRPPYLVAGIILDNPGVDISAAAFPDGEVGIAPVEESISGKIVWDTSMHYVGMINDPIVCTVEDGAATDIAGGIEARRLLDYLEEHGDSGSKTVGEVSIGINEKSRLTGYVREDKKRAGTMHVALGMNTDVGGQVSSKTHLDGVIRYPTLKIDGVIVVDHGQLAVSLD